MARVNAKEIDYQTDCWKERTQRRGKLEEVTTLVRHMGC
jgi:hypothetical protein